MIHLSDISYELLEEELERRKNMVHLMQFIPAPIDYPDWSRVKELCAANLVEIVKEKRLSEDIREYIYETAMKVVYGEKIWDWINEVCK